MTLAMDRRQLLRAAAAAAALWTAAPWADRMAFALPAGSVTPLGTQSDPETTTLEAFADTLIPGAKRFDGDHAVAGAARGAGAVQAGAVDLLTFPPAGVSSAVPGWAAGLTAEATAYAARTHLVLDPTLPPFVALPFRHRTRLALQLMDAGHPDYLAWYALGALCFLAYHTAGHLPTAHAVRHHHPGLAALRFPQPDRDGLWRFPHFSYRRRLARRHPHTTAKGSPR